jgi:hypothetical protein
MMKRASYRMQKLGAAIGFWKDEIIAKNLGWSFLRGKVIRD